MSTSPWGPPLWLRFCFLAFAGASVVTGLIAALAQLGYWLDTPAAALRADHGPLMVFGFVGGAIGLERAVAVRTRWAWCGPLASALGVITTLAGLPTMVPGAFFALSFLVLGLIYATVHHRQPSFAVITQAVGVIGGVAAALVWAVDAAFAYAMPLAVLFAVATIIGERLELARISFSGAAAEQHITALVLGLAAAALVFLVSPQIGFVAMGVMLIAVAAATVRIDVARRLINSTGLPRYSAVCMLLGYLWLIIAGAVWVAFGHVETGFAYDAGVHAVFLGFVISMIFAHAPIILSSVIRFTLPYHPAMYLAVGLLHGGLFVRLVGDFREAAALWQVGGVVNVLAVVVFLGVALTLTVRHAVTEPARREGVRAR